MKHLSIVFLKFFYFFFLQVFSYALALYRTKVQAPIDCGQGHQVYYTTSQRFCQGYFGMFFNLFFSLFFPFDLSLYRTKAKLGVLRFRSNGTNYSNRKKESIATLLVYLPIVLLTQCFLHTLLVDSSLCLCTSSLLPLGLHHNVLTHIFLLILVLHNLLLCSNALPFFSSSYSLTSSLVFV